MVVGRDGMRCGVGAISDDADYISGFLEYDYIGNYYSILHAEQMEQLNLVTYVHL